MDFPVNPWMTPMRTLPRVLSTAAVLAAGLLSACAGPERLPDLQYTLSERQTLNLPAVLRDQRLTVTYEGADDSRCPDNARCIWAGQVAYRFTLRLNNLAQGFWLIPGKPGYTSPALRGARIELDPNLTAPPRGMVEARPVAYPVVFNMYGS